MDLGTALSCKDYGDLTLIANRSFPDLVAFPIRSLGYFLPQS